MPAQPETAAVTSRIRSLHETQPGRNQKRTAPRSSGLPPPPSPTSGVPRPGLECIGLCFSPPRKIPEWPQARAPRRRGASPVPPMGDHASPPITPTTVREAEVSVAACAQQRETAVMDVYFDNDAVNDFVGLTRLSRGARRTV